MSSSEIRQRDQIDGRHGFGLSLAQAGFEHGGHAAEPELAQRTFEFDEMSWSRSPDGFLVLSMRSRYSVSWRMSGSTWRRA